jgi:hypothetical protein
MATYRIETSCIASVTLYIEADSPEAAKQRAQAASDDGPVHLWKFLRDEAGDPYLDIEALALDTASIEEEDL